jgi:hypothetical protein
MAGNSARPFAPGREPAAGGGDPLADLARLVADDRGGAAQPALPGVARDPAFHFDPALDIAADEAGDPAYPPEAYAGVPYEGDAGAPAPDLRRRGGGLALAALVLVLAVLAAGGVYGYRLVAHPRHFAEGGAPPVIKASTQPVKVAPKPTAEAKNQSKLIYDRVTSDTTAPAHVVGSAEEPEERPVAPVDHSTQVVLPGESQQASADAAALPTPAVAQDAGLARGSDVDAHEVKTIPIEPDTEVALPQVPPPIVPGNVAPPPQPAPQAQQGGSHIDAATQAEAAKIMAAVADPKVPVQGSGVAAGLTLMPNHQTGIMAGGDQPAPAAPAAPAAAPSATPAPQQTARAPVPLPLARPADLGAGSAPRPVGAPIRLGPAPAARSAALTTAEPAAGSGDYMVQLSAQRTEADAHTTFQKLQARYAKVLGQYQPVITPVKLGDRGTFYRVRIGGFATKDLAAAVCDNLRVAGGTCIVQAR